MFGGFGSPAIANADRKAGTPAATTIKMMNCERFMPKATASSLVVSNHAKPRRPPRTSANAHLPRLLRHSTDTSPQRVTTAHSENTGAHRGLLYCLTALYRILLEKRRDPL